MIIRKLKLNSLGQYIFSEKEQKYIDLIFSLNINNLTFVKINFLYLLMNLEQVEYTNYPNRIFFIDKYKNGYFQFTKNTNSFYWDTENVYNYMKVNFYISDFEIKKILIKIINTYQIKDVKIFDQLLLISYRVDMGY